MTRSVLHVVESFGAGTATAVGQYVCTDGVEHRVIGRMRDGSFAEEAWHRQVRVELAPSLWRFFVLWLRARREPVDVVHAHSTVAGLLVRLLRHPTARIIYSPHGMVALHHRRRLVRSGLRVMETLLVRRCRYVAVVGEAEKAEVSGFLRAARVELVPHALSVIAHGPRRARSARVVAVGRLSFQKAPETVAGLPTLCEDLDLEWLWIGEGDQERRDQLVDGGWAVSGWLSHDEVLKLVADSVLLLHPARYEGFPLAVLEALSCGTPVVARDIDSLAEVSGVTRFGVAEDAAALVASLVDDERAWDTTSAAGVRYVEERHHPALQAAVLQRMYG